MIIKRLYKNQRPQGLFSRNSLSDNEDLSTFTDYDSRVHTTEMITYNDQNTFHNER